MPQAAARATAARPYDQHVVSLAGHADQDQARVSLRDHRLGQDAMWEPAACHLQGFPEPLPRGILALPAQALRGHWVACEHWSGRRPGMDGNQVGRIHAGQVSRAARGGYAGYR